MSDQQPAKPGTACLGCRRRKLRCTREQNGCNNCTKADLPCVYPAAETGVKRKRGPYKKDKPPRERHLEDLVKYLEPKAAQNESGEGVGSSAYDGFSPTGASANSHEGGRGRKTSNSEDLVKDALFALTQSSVENRESSAENGHTVPKSVPSTSLPTGTLSVHPPARQIFEYWHLFCRRVDPLLKIIHVPTFEATLLKAMADLQSIGPVTQSLLFAIYHSAVGSCTNKECRRRFGENRDVLLQRYARVIESALADNYSMPVLETLQALVLYVICLRRDDSIGNIRALFSLCVRMAQLIGLQEDPGDAFSPYESELRRRLWYHISGLESRGAEEGGARQTSIMEDRHVRMPSNLNDDDLYPDMKDPPKPRTGVTDMTFPLTRWESVRTIHEIFMVKQKCRKSEQSLDNEELKAELRKVVEEHKLRCETYYLRHFDDSRPLDWLCTQWIRLMAIKSRLIVEFPLGQIPTKEMTPHERHDLLRSSVEVIRIGHTISRDKGINDWLWYFRGWVQWHSIAIVLAELGGNKNQHFVNTAWAVLDPILADWNRVYHAKKDEPAWTHVNALIEKARHLRQQVPDTPSSQTQEVTSDQNVSTNAKAGARQKPHQDAGHSQILQSSAMGLVPDLAWHSWSPSSSSATIGPQYQQSSHPTPTQQEFQTFAPPMISNIDVPFQTGCAPVMHGFESADFGYIDGLDSIDFSAFDAVFKDMAWDFSSPSTDANFEQLNAQAMS